MTHSMKNSDKNVRNSWRDHQWYGDLPLHLRGTAPSYDLSSFWGMLLTRKQERQLQKKRRENPNRIHMNTTQIPQRQLRMKGNRYK